MYLTKLKYKFTRNFYEKPHFRFFGNDFYNLPCFDRGNWISCLLDMCYTSLNFCWIGLSNMLFIR